ncbi:MAG: hypothetical protein AAGE01_07495 [Pseudomonadota bacterium]
MTRIAILQHDVSRSYLLHAVAAGWPSRGIELIHHAGPAEIPSADVLFLHVDLTVLPAAYREAVADHPFVINRDAVDITRGRYSRLLLERTSSWKGTVIVKTNHNYGGIPEETERQRRGVAQRATSSWARTRTLNPRRYPLFPSVAQVPRGVWRNPQLVVERFLPERQGDLFFVRYWSFLGDASMTGRLGSRHHVVKFSTMVTDTGPTRPPPELRELRERLGLDYGRFDYVVHGDDVFVLDANKTMGQGSSDPAKLRQYRSFGLRAIEGLLGPALVDGTSNRGGR